MSVKRVAPTPTTWYCEFALPENLPAGSTVVGTIYRTGKAGAGESLVVLPPNEIVHIQAVLSTEGVVSGGVDADIVPEIGGLDQEAIGIVSATNMNITNGKGVELTPTIVIDRSQRFRLKLKTHAEMGETGVTQVLLLKVLIVPV